MSYGAEAVILVETGFPTLRTQSFNPNDNEKLLLRKVLGTKKNPAWGKLGPNWERPYRIISLADI